MRWVAGFSMSFMPLLLLDLDNTLVDRAAAFREWAEAFNHQRGARPGEIEWLIFSDRDGLEGRAQFSRTIAARFGLDDAERSAVHRDLLLGMVDRMSVDSAVVQALDRARAAGWRTVVVSNGTTDQQTRKLKETGLSDHLDAWVISESAGVAKPEPRIFQMAAEAGGLTLDGAWMIGDSAEADIGGAHRLGLRNIWLSRSRNWPIRSFTPTITAKSCADAIAAAICAEG